MENLIKSRLTKPKKNWLAVLSLAQLSPSLLTILTRRMFNKDRFPTVPQIVPAVRYPAIIIGKTGGVRHHVRWPGGPCLGLARHLVGGQERHEDREYEHAVHTFNEGH